MTSAKKRIGIIDGVRGHLLLGMLVAHLSFSAGLAWLGWFHHAKVIKLYDAEFFVLVSGALVGFLRVERYKTNRMFYGFLAERIKTIYIYYLFSAIAYLILTRTPDGETVFSHIVNVLLLQSGGNYSDILPLYLYCFMILALIGWTINSGFPWLLFVASAVLYFISQYSDDRGFLGVSGDFVVFDVAAWQFLFMLAMLLGVFHRRVEACVVSLSRSHYYGVLTLCFATFLIWGHAAKFGLTEPQWLVHPTAYERMQLTPWYLMKILSIATIFVFLLIRREPLTGPLSGLLEAYFRLTILATIGRYSIQMFTLHVAMMGFYGYVAGGLTNNQNSMLAVLLIMIFVAAPWTYESMQKRLRAH